MTTDTHDAAHLDKGCEHVYSGHVWPASECPMCLRKRAESAEKKRDEEIRLSDWMGMTLRAIEKHGTAGIGSAALRKVLIAYEEQVVNR